MNYTTGIRRVVNQDEAEPEDAHSRLVGQEPGRSNLDASEESRSRSTSRSRSGSGSQLAILGKIVSWEGVKTRTEMEESGRTWGTNGGATIFRALAWKRGCLGSNLGL